MRMLAVLSMFLCLGSSPVFAWGKNGHRITGALAERYLSDDAKAGIVEILGPSEGLAEASTWPDEMRSNPDPFWQDVSPPFHYVTVPKGKKYEDVGPPGEGDALTALKMFSRTIKDPNAPKDRKQLALRFMVHIIGDLHQPLHCGDGTDRGGNDVKVDFFGEQTNLHWVWDTGLIDHEKLSYSEFSDWLGAKITPDMARQWATPDPLVWIDESTTLRDGLYPDGDKLSWTYVYNHMPTIKRRLQMGGVRIAAYLNALFAK